MKGRQRRTWEASSSAMARYGWFAEPEGNSVELGAKGDIRLENA